MKNDQSNHKTVQKVLFHKIKPGMNCFVHSRVWRHSRWIQKFVQSSFPIKSLKLCHKSSGEIFALGPF